MKIITRINQEKGIAIDFLCRALAIPRATYYRYQNETEVQLLQKQSLPANALSGEEKKKILTLLHSEQYVDKTPYEVFNSLLDEGQYRCSVRTMYRVLGEKDENHDRRPQRSHRDAVKPELIATQPNEVWSWDITKLLGMQKWVYYYLYVILDIFSRHVVGWLLADCESQSLARKLIQETALKHGIQPYQLTLHADRGPVMTSQTVAQLLDHLGVAKTHNRPYTSNDNPFSESQFKTLKYCPEFPGRFESLKTAESFCRRFFTWYNKEHYHSGIAWLTPESVHYGKGQNILAKRHQALMQAFSKNPIRFNNKPPKLKQLPSAVYINPPQTVLISSLQKGAIMA